MSLLVTKMCIQQATWSRKKADTITVLSHFTYVNEVKELFINMYVFLKPLFIKGQFYLQFHLNSTLWRGMTKASFVYLKKGKN